MLPTVGPHPPLARRCPGPPPYVYTYQQRGRGASCSRKGCRAHLQIDPWSETRKWRFRNRIPPSSCLGPLSFCLGSLASASCSFPFKVVSSLPLSHSLSLSPSLFFSLSHHPSQLFSASIFLPVSLLLFVHRKYYGCFQPVIQLSLNNNFMATSCCLNYKFLK